MASIVKHGDKWRAMVYRRGVRVTKILPTKTEARLWAAKAVTEIDQEHPVVKEATLHHAFDRYIEEVCPKHKGARFEMLRLLKIKREIKDVKLAKLTPAILAEWRDAQTLAPATTRREMQLMNAVFEVCRKEWGYLHINPLKDVSRPTAPPARRRGVTQDEIDAVLAGLHWSEELLVTKSQQVACLFLLALETAMRKGEMLSLTPETCFLDQQYVVLPATKNGDRRQVPLSKRAVELLKKVKCQFTVSSASADALFRKISPPGLHFHDSRSEGITRLAKKLEILDLARAIGHRDPKSLMWYFAEKASDLAKKLD